MRAKLSAICWAAILTAGVALACAGCAPRPAAPNCLLAGVRAIEHHVTVRSVPAACAGLTQAQLNQIVSAAVREAAGPHPKAANRRIEAADARYLAALVKTVAPPRAAAASPPARPQPAGNGPGLIALGFWAATAAAGAYLFASHRGRGRMPAITIGHPAAALAGLAVWAAFAVTRVQSLAWTAAALVVAASGLGMAVLVMSVSGPAAQGPDLPAPGLTPRRVFATVCHFTLAVGTLLFVLLAATGSG